ALLDEPVAQTDDAIAAQGQRLLALGCPAVLIKGGHASGAESIDFLVRREGVIRLAGPRIATQNTHGTGCTLSSAIAAQLAKGRDLDTAARDAKDYIGKALVASDQLAIGRGHGPVHHF